MRVLAICCASHAVTSSGAPRHHDTRPCFGALVMALSARTPPAATGINHDSICGAQTCGGVLAAVGIENPREDDVAAAARPAAASA
jgi:hypothetical protein